MKNAQKRNVFARTLFVLLVVFLAIYFASIVVGYTPFYNNHAERNAQTVAYEEVGKVEALIEERYQDLIRVKDEIVDKTSHDAVSDVVKKYIGSNLFGDLRFFAGGKIYDANGLEVNDEAEQIKAFSGLSDKAFSGEFVDRFVAKSCVAFYVPVTGSTHIDGLASVIEARNFISTETLLNEKSQAIAIITESGSNLCDKTRVDSGLTVGNNYYSFIENFTQNKNYGYEISRLINAKTMGTTLLNVNGEKYVVAVSPLENVDNKLFFVSLSKSKNIMATEMEYLSHIIALLVIAIISLLISLIYAWLYHKSTKKKIRYANYTYKDLDCPNVEQFKIDIVNNMSNTTILSKKYSVVAFKIRSFVAISKMLGEKDANEALKKATQIFSGVCSFDEAYAYLGDGVFVMLIRYHDETTFVRKLNMIKAFLAKNSITLSKEIPLRFRIGVCHAFGGTKGTAMEMVDNALAACKIAEEKTNAPFVVFDAQINEEMAKNEKIESMMEDGLKNGDFKLFLQPKYDVKHDRVDSAEALVRWFDRARADYIFPGEFIGLFETNGFIVKLDHYIYLEVLKYFKSAVERGEKIVPVSVNVSRVTVAAPDFLDFYISNKKKYGIGDGFLMLEITESFACEENKSIVEIVNKLHQNGIKCALDDFGAGFSSFRTLKNIDFDEIKLDKCFIEKEDFQEKGDLVLKTIVSLFKDLGMTVVQEGVETEETLNKLVEYGCDVIQGYYYAKAIPLEEYKLFLKTNTSIAYKSKVK